MFKTTLFTIAETWKQPVSTDEWIDKKVFNTHTHTHTHTHGCYSAVKNEETLPFVTMWVDFEGIMLKEVNQTDNDKYCNLT